MPQTVSSVVSCVGGSDTFVVSQDVEDVKDGAAVLSCDLWPIAVKTFFLWYEAKMALSTCPAVGLSLPPSVPEVSPLTIPELSLPHLSPRVPTFPRQCVLWTVNFGGGGVEHCLLSVPLFSSTSKQTSKQRLQRRVHTTVSWLGSSRAVFSLQCSSKQKPNTPF